MSLDTPIAHPVRIAHPDLKAVVKRPYSRAIIRSFRVTQSHSFPALNSLSFHNKNCETHVNVDGADFAPNQIPPSALRQGVSVL